MRATAHISRLLDLLDESKAGTIDHSWPPLLIRGYTGQIVDHVYQFDLIVDTGMPVLTRPVLRSEGLICPVLTLSLVAQSPQ
jgi:hypothetical protein